MEAVEKFFKCPYCLQKISMILEPSDEGGPQVYIEDCEVCCNPIELTYETHAEKITNFRTSKAYE
ncbi:MAG: CPXCG motif-containing cysteine-rich protein [Bdellovibrionaceae bacterium]|nr:CPXCG motif-containing cysteine-rich protein [Pseudobdellovibrionaceae bacterium]